LLFLAVASAPFGLGVLISDPPARLAEGLRAFSDIRAQILAGVGWRFDASPVPTMAMTSVPSARPPQAAPAVAPVPVGDLLAYGDRLKITFYESIGVALEERRAGPSQTIAAIFPRMDLSAEYSVDEGGSLAIPRLGRFAVAGQTVTAVQAALSAAFEQTIGRSADVHLAIVERQPVYVLGTVRNAGTFKYAPGMTVLQALTVVGGIDAGIADTSKAIESIRETQRLRQTEARLDRLFINEARLVAAREDSDDLTVPANILPRLSEPASRVGLAGLIAGARAALTDDRARYQRQLSFAQRQIGVARIERDAQNARAAQLIALLAKKSDRLRDLEGIASFGSVSHLKLTDVGVEISEVTARREDLRVALAQSESRLVEAEIALAKIQLDHSAGIDRELSATRQEIEDCTMTIAAMRAVTRVLRATDPRAPDTSVGVPFLRITRRTADGIAVMPATESTAVLPGDVVQVNFTGRLDAAGGGPAQSVKYLQ
jgi:protein involved in polysaccharide export with SLBB domain